MVLPRFCYWLCCYLRLCMRKKAKQSFSRQRHQLRTRRCQPGRRAEGTARPPEQRGVCGGGGGQGRTAPDPERVQCFQKGVRRRPSSVLTIGDTNSYKLSKCGENNRAAAGPVGDRRQQQERWGGDTSGDLRTHMSCCSSNSPVSTNVC